MEGHGPNEVQHDQDRDHGRDDYGGDDPAPAIASAYASSSAAPAPGSRKSPGVRTIAAPALPGSHSAIDAPAWVISCSSNRTKVSAETIATTWFRTRLPKATPRIANSDASSTTPPSVSQTSWLPVGKEAPSASNQM